MGAEVSCVVADLTLGTSTGAGADWTPATPTQGVVTGAGGCFSFASFPLQEHREAKEKPNKDLSKVGFAFLPPRLTVFGDTV